MPLIRILVDADACPVKQEVYRVAQRHAVSVLVVSNTWMRVPENGAAELILVGQGFDEADDWIVEQAGIGDIVVTSDLPLAARVLKKGAAALNPKGNVYTEASMGDVLATREILASLREHGVATGGPRPFEPRDRSRFLQRLEDLLQAAKRAQ
jgi:uncharacterized protein YaiI (UPF0178 family)